MADRGGPAPATPGCVVVTGASGNVGAGVLRALASRLPEAQVIGVCRRPPTRGPLYESVRWHSVDLAQPTAAQELAPVLRDADVVVHLALAVQPVRDEDYLYRANVLGSQAVFDALASAGVRQLVYASSLGIYAAGAASAVTEDWPDTGQRTSIYSRHKVAVERLLDRFAAEHPEIAIARFRPTVVVQREAAWLIRSLYVGRLVPQVVFEALRQRRLPVLPLPRGVELQFVHADDVGDAVVSMILQRAHGSYNVAADVLASDALADLVGARPLSVPSRLVRRVVSALAASRLIALVPGWYDVAFNTPVMDTAKIRRDLGWAPKRSSSDSARELIEGLADGTVGCSAAMGADATPVPLPSAQRVHDVALLAWTVLATLRAARVRGVTAPLAVAATANLVAGTPIALQRVLERRTDPAAVAAPIAVTAALATTWRGGWTAVAATAVLHLLNACEGRRRRG